MKYITETYTSSDRLPGYLYQQPSPGDLDLSFGNDGFLTIPGIGVARPTQDGKYWTVVRHPEIQNRIEIGKLLEDGTPDPAFTKVTLDLAWASKLDQLAKVSLQSSGKLIVFAPVTLADGTYRVLVARFDEEGQLDVSFGDNNGLLLIDSGYDDFPYAAVYDIIVQSDDKIVACLGSARFSEFNATMGRIVRLTENGSFDDTFGVNGIVASFAQGQVLMRPLALKDGKLLIGGVWFKNGSALVMRLDAAGNLDTTFGQNGVIYPTIPGDVPVAALVAEGGRGYLIGGHTENFMGWLTRIRSNGTTDDSFNGAKPLLFTEFTPMAGVLQEDGKFVCTGLDPTRPARGLIACRINHDGAYDPAFGSNGFVYHDHVPNGIRSDYAYVVIQENRLFIGDRLVGLTETSMRLARILL
jgi:uncharacterized delta-60 repeat protein